MSKACLMLPLDFDSPKFFHFANSLDKSLLADDGIEWFNHSTILYGIDDQIQSTLPLARLINALHMFPVKLGKISFFRTNPDFDVMKVDVHSPALHIVNDLVRKSVPYTNNFPEYIPHFTIAYVKKGSFKELDGSDYFEGMVFNPDNVVYSYEDHSTLSIPFYNNKKVND